MRAGRLRHRVTIQQATETRDTFGDPVATWGTFATRWMHIEPLTGQERFAAEQHHAEVTHRFTGRYKSGVTAKMRLSYDSRTFDIEAVLDIEERGCEMQLLARENT